MCHTRVAQTEIFRHLSTADICSPKKRKCADLQNPFNFSFSTTMCLILWWDSNTLPTITIYFCLACTGNTPLKHQCVRIVYVSVLHADA